MPILFRIAITWSLSHLPCRLQEPAAVLFVKLASKKSGIFDNDFRHLAEVFGNLNGAYTSYDLCQEDAIQACVGH